MRLRLVGLLLSCAASPAVHAQGAEFYTPFGGMPGDAAFENAQQQESARLRAALGVGVAVAPTFPGADNYRAHLAPAIHLAYGPVFFGIGGLGINLFRGEGWRFGVNVMPSRGREQSAD